MKTSSIVLIVIGALILILGIWSWSGYNGLVTKQIDTEGKWAMVESQYQRRMDLFSNVVNTIKGSAEFEKSTLQAVIEARSKATSINVDASKLTPESIAQFQQAQGNLSSSFSRLLVTVEQYPNLKTTEAFRDFQAQIEGTENRINKARDDFNKSVQGFNTSIRRFPTVLVAGMLGFTAKGYFKAAEGSEKAPEVKF